MPESPPRGDVRLLRKYPNRRIYDTELRRYLTLAELGTMVKGGLRVRVLDTRDDADVTRAVLLQVIAEQDGLIDAMPVELLHLLLRAHGTLHQAPLTASLQQVMGRAMAWSDAWVGGVHQWWPLGAAVGAAAGGTNAPEPDPRAVVDPPGPNDAAEDPVRARMDALLSRLRG